jgi:hypothetical protein
MPLIAVDGDAEPYSDAHVPPTGGGDKTIPGTLQTFVRIAGKPVILQGQEFPTDCPICDATCTAGTTGASRSSGSTASRSAGQATSGRTATTTARGSSSPGRPSSPTTPDLPFYSAPLTA